MDTPQVTPQVKFVKTYGNHTGRRFHQFQVSTPGRWRTFDIIFRRGRREPETMTKAQAEARALQLFSMGDEIEIVTQQVVQRFRQYGENELFRCFQISMDAGVYDRWIKWLVDSGHPLANEPGSPEWRFSQYIRQESALWA